VLKSTLEPFLQAPGADGLVRFLNELEGRFSSFASERTGFLAQLSEYVMTGSGKRLRPALVYLASRFGPADENSVREAAIGVELIHIATLVHDDLVDQALLRRRKPTVAVKFGDGAAVLLGDHVYADAFRRVAVMGDPELLRLFADATLEMCDGEIGQYEGRYRFDLSESDYLSFLRKKTAALMAVACRVGGRLAGLPEDSQSALATFGDRVGVAFQIVDDLLDIEGDEAVVGKTLLTDLSHGKMTLPLIYYIQSFLPKVERDAFIARLKSPSDSLASLVDALRRSGVMDLCRKKAASLLDEAEAALAVLPDHPSRRLLSDVARRLLDRKL
jgi:geranylgeranyl pyrophosphate synthase